MIMDITIDMMIELLEAAKERIGGHKLVKIYHGEDSTCEIRSAKTMVDYCSKFEIMITPIDD